MTKKYDYVIVGAGLFGSIFAHEMTNLGKKCLVIDRRPHIGGNIYTENIEGINVHLYGAHIFHTNDPFIWKYINKFCEFNQYINSPIARFGNKIYNLPFNMNTFNQLWGVITPEDALLKIQEQIQKENISGPTNLEEQALSLVGRDIYEKLIKGYTEKQWGRKATEIPAFIIQRLPLRFTYNNNYFNDRYQGIPIGGYTKIIENMLKNIDVELDTDFLLNREYFTSNASKIVFTGMIDEYFEYCYGTLEYRSLNFETSILDTPNYQGNAVVNYTAFDVPYTRIIEHKHFEFGNQEKTIITKEYPADWSKGDEPYYPINNDENDKLYKKYTELAKKNPNLIFGGRLGMYKYLDMHQIVSEALKCVNNEKL